MSKTIENTNKILKFISEKHQSEELDNDSLVSICVLCFDYLNLKTISQFAKENGKSYRGVKEFNKNIISINKNKFVMDIQ
jgi:hypothetical protein